MSALPATLPPGRSPCCGPSAGQDTVSQLWWPHTGPPRMSWGLTSHRSAGRRSSVTNTGESSWELTPVSSSESHTNVAAKFYLTLCHHSCSGAYVRGQHVELVRETKLPSGELGGTYACWSQGAFPGVLDFYKVNSRCLFLFLPFPEKSSGSGKELLQESQPQIIRWPASPEPAHWLFS